MRAEAADLAGAGAFEVPAAAGGPEGYLAGLAGDLGAQGDAVGVGPLGDELAYLGPEALAGLQAFVIEALVPELVVEEGVDVGRGVQTGRQD